MLVAVLVALSGCLEPGELDDPEQYLARINGDGGLLDGSLLAGSGGASGGGGSAAPVGDGGADDPCAPVVSKLMKTCVASVCHGNDSSNTLKLEDPGLPARLVGQKATSTCMELPYIDPAAPEKSLLYTKMSSKPPCGSPMPLGQMVPTPAQRECVLQWIKDGLGGNPSTPGTDAGMTNPGNMPACMTKDSDDDGTNDCDDMCVNDEDKTKPGVCGCGMPDEDSDDDGALDCEDDCPDDPAKMMGECDVPGLLVGSLPGNVSMAENPGNMGVDPLGLTASEKVDVPEMTTLVFTGQVHITSTGVATFYENYDDKVRLFVDDQMILSNDTWDEPTSGTIMRPEGWYDFELRLGNGELASGPPPDMGIGIGYSPMNEMGSTDDADYVHPANMNATTGNLFRTTKP